MKNMVILFCWMIACLVGCKTNNKEENSVVSHVDVDWNSLKQKDSHLSDFVVSYKYVPLETSPECLMGWINKVVVRDSTMFILESSGSGRLFMFSNEGKYLRKIDRFGKGPGEYIGIYDFEVTDDNSKIYILTKSNSILIFNIDGSFERALYLSDAPAPVTLMDFVITKEALAFNIVSTKDNSFLTTDLDGKFISYGQPVPGIAYVSDQLSHGLGYSTYVKRICDTIFKIDRQGQLSPYLHIDFGNDALTIDDWNKAPLSQNGWFKMIPHSYARFSRFYDLKDYFFLQFTFFDEDQEEGCFLLGSRTRNDLYWGEIPTFNDFFDLTLSLPLATFPESNIVCTWVYPSLIHESVTKYHQKSNRKFHVIDSLCAVCDKEDNPIIAFYKLNINK